MSGESKQIDEDENGPENGGLKSGPCLIAGFHALSCTSPSYYNPYRGVNKNTLSVDMVRLSLTFKGDRGEWLSRKGAQLKMSKTDWSVFGNERTELRETLESFNPSLPRFGAGKLREKLSAAQSSITSLLSAMDLRAASEQELRECESKWKSLEAEYRARSNI